MFEEFEATSLEEWAQWLLNNHTASRGVWLITYKKGRGPHVAPFLANREAVRFGWVRDRPAPLDDQRSKHLFWPRRPYQSWSPEDRLLAEQLLAAGTLSPAGAAAVDRARTLRCWDGLDMAHLSREPLDLVEALEAAPDLREKFDQLAPQVRNRLLWWLTRPSPAQRSDRLRQTLTTIRRTVIEGPWWLSEQPTVSTRSTDATVIETSVGAQIATAIAEARGEGALRCLVGPSGIGKSFAIRAVADQHPGHVFRVGIERVRCPPVSALVSITTSVNGNYAQALPYASRGSIFGARHALFAALCRALGSRPEWVRAGAWLPHAQVAIIIDDAQHLSARALDEVLALNSGATTATPLALGLVLVGSSQFSHDLGSRAAVTRLQGVHRSEAAAYLTARGLTHPVARRAALRLFERRGAGSFRKLVDLADAIEVEAAGAPITPSIVRRTADLG